MKSLVAALLTLLMLRQMAGAHALDQYIQAELVSVEAGRIDVALRLVPGVAVLPDVLRGIDTDGDGALSGAEESAYARQVLADMQVTLDGRRIVPHLIAASVPSPAELQGGLGEIHIDYTAPLPRAPGLRKLVIENRHRPRISAYLANALVSTDPQIRLLVQRRNANQSVYELDFDENGTGSGTPAVDASGFGQMFRIGVRHIAEGADHLLFLLALLLPTPLLALNGRWSAPAPVARSLLHIGGVVTAFTLGHSITLALASLAGLTIPSRTVEILIAVSILVSALHALRPLFPGREAAVAAGFGLVHGMAFASVLGRLGLNGWERAVNLFAFNLGIEAMQLLVVAATLPSLLLLSRTRAYGVLRVGGAVFAGVAALGWIAQRAWGFQLPVDVTVDAVAHQAGLLVGVLTSAALACWAYSRGRVKQSL